MYDNKSLLILKRKKNKYFYGVNRRFKQVLFKTDTRECFELIHWFKHFLVSNLNK